MYWKTRQQIRRKILWDRNIIFPWVFPMVIWSSLKYIYIYGQSTIFRQFLHHFQAVSDMFLFLYHSVSLVYPLFHHGTSGRGTQIIGARGWIKRQLPTCLDDRKPTINGDTLKLFYLFAGYLIYIYIYIRWRHIIQDGDSTNCWNRKKNLT